MPIINGQVFGWEIEGCDYSKAPADKVLDLFRTAGLYFERGKNLRIVLTPEEETAFEEVFRQKGQSLEAGIRSMIETVVDAGSFECSYSELTFIANAVSVA